jgi:hypothetical protein
VFSDLQRVYHAGRHLGGKAVNVLLEPSCRELVLPNLTRSAYTTWTAALISLGTDPACIVLCIDHRLPPGNWTRYHPCHASTAIHRRTLRLYPEPYLQVHSSPATRPAEAPTRSLTTLTKPVCLGGLVQIVQELHDEASRLAPFQIITTASLR